MLWSRDDIRIGVLLPAAAPSAAANGPGEGDSDSSDGLAECGATEPDFICTHTAFVSGLFLAPDLAFTYLCAWYGLFRGSPRFQ